MATCQQADSLDRQLMALHGILHDENNNDSPSDEWLVSYSQCSYDEFLCKSDEIESVAKVTNSIANKWDVFYCKGNEI